MSSLADADAVAEAITRLAESPLVAAEFGGPEHVSGEVEGPWPHITVAPSGTGDLRGLIGGSMASGVRLQFTADPHRAVGAADLWRKAMLVMLEAVTWPDTEQVPDRPVVAHVQPRDYPLEQSTVSGQDRVVVTLELVVAPPHG